MGICIFAFTNAPGLGLLRACKSPTMPPLCPNLYPRAKHIAGIVFNTIAHFCRSTKESLELQEEKQEELMNNNIYNSSCYSLYK